MIQQQGNQIRRAQGNQHAHPVIVTPHSRQPVDPGAGTNSGLGTNLSSTTQPKTSSVHVANPYQRKIG
jgi:hypothetical protein